MPIEPLARTRRTTCRPLLAGVYALGTLAHVFLWTTRPETYETFAELALVGVYEDLWLAVVVPNLAVLVPAVIAVEALVAVTILWGGRAGVAGNAIGAAFQLALVPAGPWGLLNLLLAGVHVWLAWTAADADRGQDTAAPTAP